MEKEQYSSPKSITEWLRPDLVEFASHDEFSKASSAFDRIDAEARHRAVRLVSRIAAVETGAVEELYKTDRGITFSIATESAIISAVFADEKAETHSLIESQLEAYEHVLDFATGNRPIALAWIRELHSILCRSQKTFEVRVNGAREHRPLELGAYKTTPNHVHVNDTLVHEYAPPEQVAAEMQRLMDEISSTAFETAAPVIQASYAHHFLTAVHPFSDGNGRVARALASTFLYRAYSVPLLILADERQDYFDALLRADKSDFQPLIRYSARVTGGALSYINQSLKAGALPETPEQLLAIGRLYRSRDGITHEEVDRGAYAALERFEHDLRTAAAKLDTSKAGINLGIAIQQENATHQVKSPATHRVLLVNGAQRIRIRISSPPPGDATVDEVFVIDAPRTPDAQSTILLRGLNHHAEVTIPIRGIVPRVTMSEELQISLYVERVIRQLLKIVNESARARLRANGYLA